MQWLVARRRFGLHQCLSLAVEPGGTRGVDEAVELGRDACPCDEPKATGGPDLFQSDPWGHNAAQILRRTCDAGPLGRTEAWRIEPQHRRGLITVREDRPFEPCRFLGQCLEAVGFAQDAVLTVR